MNGWTIAGLLLGGFLLYPTVSTAAEWWGGRHYRRRRKELDAAVVALRERGWDDRSNDVYVGEGEYTNDDVPNTIVNLRYDDRVIYTTLHRTGEHDFDNIDVMDAFARLTYG